MQCHCRSVERVGGEGFGSLHFCGRSGDCLGGKEVGGVKGESVLEFLGSR